MRRALVVGAVGTACALVLGGAACQPPSPTPLCGNGRYGEPGSILSADGDHVAFLSDRLDPGPDANSTACDVFIRTLSTGVVERVTSEATAASAPLAISSDGGLVLTTNAGTAELVDVGSGEVVESRPTGGWRTADLTPDGRYLVWAGRLDVFRLDRQTRDVVGAAFGTDPFENMDTINGVSISDSGAAIAVSTYSGLHSWDVAAETTREYDSLRSLRAEISPDGAAIARLSEDLPDVDGSVWLVDRSSGAMSSVPGSADLASMAWSTEGSWLAFVSRNQTLAGDLTGLDPKDLGAQSVYARRLRDERTVRLFRPGFLGWPDGPTINLVISATERNLLNSPTDRRFEVVALEP